MIEQISNWIKIKHGMRVNKLFIRNEFERSPRADLLLAEAQPLFVLSTGRSGTRYIASSYFLDSRVISYHKNTPELKVLHRLLHQNISSPHTALLFSRAEPIMQAHLLRMHYLETNHHVTSFGKTILDLLPRAKFLYVHREFDEYATSSFKRGSYRDIWVDRGKLYLDSAVGLKNNLDKAKYDYDLTFTKISEIREACDSAAFVEVRLQDLDTEWKSICSRLSFPYRALNGFKNK